MEIDAEKSQLGPIESGIPISISATGEVIKSPTIETTTAQTTVSALDGQTVVLGGLITKTKSEFHRKVPFVGDLPIVGNLFRYDGVTNQKSELLIIMTPHIVKSDEDIEEIKRTEAARMHWCLCDVHEMAGDLGLRSRADDWPDAETHVVYPDLEPDGRMLELPEGPEFMPAPSETPFEVERVPTPADGPTPTAPRPPAAPIEGTWRYGPPPLTDYRTPAPPAAVPPPAYPPAIAPAPAAAAQPGAVIPSTYYSPPQAEQPAAVQPAAVHPASYYPPSQPAAAYGYQHAPAYPAAPASPQAWAARPPQPGVPMYR